MNDDKVGWSGNFPAVVSPFTEAGEIDEQKFRANVELLIDEGVHGVVVSGSNGESWALTGEERLRLFRLAKEVAGGRITVIGGTGSIRTGDVVELTQRAKALGIDGVMIMPPYYCQPGRRDVVEHYRMISDQAAFPILVYNSPGATGTNVTADFAEELADIDWIVAIKQSCPDFVQFEQTVAAVGERLRVFTGHSATRGMASVLVGAVGFVSSMDPHVMGAEGISLFELSRSGRLDEARAVQMRTLAVAKQLGAIGPGPAVMKAAMNLLGRPGGQPRRPLLPLDAAQTEAARGVLAGLGLLDGARAAAE